MGLCKNQRWKSPPNVVPADTCGGWQPGENYAASVERAEDVLLTDEWSADFNAIARKARRMCRVCACCLWGDFPGIGIWKPVRYPCEKAAGPG